MPERDDEDLAIEQLPPGNRCVTTGKSVVVIIPASTVSLSEMGRRSIPGAATNGVCFLKWVHSTPQPHKGPWIGDRRGMGVGFD